MRYLNLTLLVLFPVAWFAPMLKAGLLPLFGLREISVVTGLQALWGSDVYLALLVTVFALFAPYLKTIGLALVHFDLASPRIVPALSVLGKLAMADIFLIALYIVVAKGIGYGRVETAWGLYLFTGCILASLARQPDRRPAAGRCRIGLTPAPAWGTDGAWPAPPPSPAPPAARPYPLVGPMRRLRRLEHDRRGSAAHRRPADEIAGGAARRHHRADRPRPRRGAAAAHHVGAGRARPGAGRRAGRRLGDPGRRRSRHRQVHPAAAGRRRLRPRAGCPASTSRAKRPRRRSACAPAGWGWPMPRCGWAPRPACATS